MAKVALLLVAEQIVQHPRRHVMQVGGPFPQVFVLDARQCRRVALRHGVKGMLGVDLVLLDHPHHFVEQRAVFEHQQVRVENTPFLRSHPFADLSLDLENLMPRLDERSFQAINLFRQFRLRDLPPGDAWPVMAQHDDLSAAHASGNRYAPENLFSLLRSCWHG